ncbi:MAG: hypothetical protein JWR69_1893 [Pedosphaera sp.]|nr:hypothetical protein [Pedosphaera sp.]
MNRHTVIAGLLLLSLTAGRVAAAEETNSASALDLPSFRIISERNIFNPNRSGRNPKADTANPQKAPKIDTFALLGTLSYEKGRFAFFDGSSPNYKKALKTADTIAGYQVAEITASYVKLAATNQPTINLLVGMQMKREEEGPWSMTERAESYTSPTSSVTSESPKSNTSGEGMSDVMKRLMQKREQESK